MNINSQISNFNQIKCCLYGPRSVFDQKTVFDQKILHDPKSLYDSNTINRDMNLGNLFVNYSITDFE